MTPAARRLFCLHLIVSSAGCSTPAWGEEPVIGGPCDGCEFVFVDRPKVLDSTARIVEETPGTTALTLEGTVFTADGERAAGIIVYAYQTDARGIYPKATTRHGALRAWIKTDADGRYRFDTIIPAGYPNRTTPKHIHMHVIEPGVGTYYIDDVMFVDDPRLTPKMRQHYRRGRGGFGIVTPKVDSQDRLRARRDIHLGRSIPGYPKPTTRTP